MSGQGPSKPPGPSKRRAETFAERNYDVGYAKPPADHKFKAGVSGNPAGRPRKPRPETRTITNISLHDQLWLEEASAPVKVRVDGKVCTMSAEKAVILSLRQKALGGGIMAARIHITNSQNAQRALLAQQTANFKELVEFEAMARREFARREAVGESTDDLLPHPDDCILDPRAGWGCIAGPISESERAALQPMVDLRDEQQQAVSAAARTYNNVTGRRRNAALENWHRAQHVYDRLNDHLPPSLKCDLTDRSTQFGATKPGDFRQWTADAIRASASKGLRPRGRRG